MLVIPEPADIMSSVGATTPTVKVLSRDADLVAKISTLAHIVTWPARKPITVDVSVQMPDNRTEYATISLSPKSPLADEWHALTLDALPIGTGTPVYLQRVDWSG